MNHILSSKRFMRKELSLPQVATPNDANYVVPLVVKQDAVVITLCKDVFVLLQTEQKSVSYRYLKKVYRGAGYGKDPRKFTSPIFDQPIHIRFVETDGAEPVMFH